MLVATRDHDNIGGRTEVHSTEGHDEVLRNHLTVGKTRTNRIRQALRDARAGLRIRDQPAVVAVDRRPLAGGPGEPILRIGAQLDGFDLDQQLA